MRPYLDRILKELHPAISVGALLVGIVVWAYNTFAQLSYVKEQNAGIMALVDQRHKDALDHSDMNRDRMLSVMQEIKDAIKLMEYRDFPERRPRR